MSIDGDVKEVANISYKLSLLSSKTQDFGNAMEIIDECGKFAKFSGALGVLGAGLGLITTFMGGKSDTEKILDAIKDVSNQINELHDRMEYHFEQLKSEIKQDLALDNFQSWKAKFKAVKRDMDELYKIENQKSEKARSIRAVLRDFSTAEIQEGFEYIASLFGINDQGIDINLLEETYKVSNGSFAKINLIASGMYSQLILATVIWGLINSLGKSEDEMKTHTDKWVDDQRNFMTNIFKGPMTKAHSAWESWYKKCQDDFHANANQFLIDRINKASDRGNHKKTAEYLCHEFSANYDVYDWVVIVYDPVSGWDRHKCNGVHYFMSWRYQGINVTVGAISKALAPREMTTQSVSVGDTWLTTRLGMGGIFFSVNFDNLTIVNFQDPHGSNDFRAWTFRNDVEIRYGGMHWLGTHTNEWIECSNRSRCVRLSNGDRTAVLFPISFKRDSI